MNTYFLNKSFRFSSNLFKCVGSRTFSSSVDDYEYIQRSKVPTMHFQPSLPRLPIPELEKTCQRYLNALKPILDEEAFKHTREVVEKFRDGHGRILHTELLQKDKMNKHTSYISEPWFDMYLADRKPLPINYNPTLIFVDDENVAYNSQLVRSSNLLISSIRFYKSLKDNLLEPEVFHMDPKKSDTKWFRTVTRFLPSSISWYGAYLFKAYPLDMCQYSKLFSSSRIPQQGKDCLYQNMDQRHVVIMRRGHFYTFNVLDDKGMILPPEIIYSCIGEILKDERPKSDQPIGVFTSDTRDKWAEIRKRLEKNGNYDVLKVIDDSLFVISLDDEVETDPVKLVKQFLHSNGENRWFDKSFTLIVSANGVSGLNFEHSWGDGVAILRYFQDIFKDSTTEPRVHPDMPLMELSAEVKPKVLEFRLDETLKKDINHCKARFKTIYDSLGVDFVLYEGLGKGVCKKHKVSPDAVMQLAFQLAYHKLHGKQVASYESCSTAAFRHGRTETVRPCTMETKNFCYLSSAMADEKSLLDSIKKCSEMHGQLVKEAAMGNGFDRHLFVLRKMAEKNMELPEIYTDYSYYLINRNILSTSTLSSEVVKAGGFGPVEHNGYGIAYMIRRDMCGSIITSYNQHTDVSGFKKCLYDSFHALYSVLSK